MKTKWIFKFQKMLKFKKIQDLFDEVKDEAKTVEPNDCFIDDTDFFEQENVSENSYWILLIEQTLYLMQKISRRKGC